MDKSTVEDWLRTSFRDVAPLYQADAGLAWWPDWGTGGQGQATSWVWAAILRAGHAIRVETPNLQLWFGTPWHASVGHQHREVREKLVSKLWTNHEHCRHSPYEVLVDFTISDYGSKGSPILISAESEMHPHHGVGPAMAYNDDTAELDDYTWDFYKLLLVRSQRRLFFARVGAVGEMSENARMEKLKSSVAEVLEWYGDALIGPDELAVVILPEDPSNGWSGIRLGVWSGTCLEWTDGLLSGE